ncbi:hypothetical protein M758_12G050400 [Ceratodon purpureus]|nr:hypothetical protein M758_12G050400 [Ceratodon purpureus]
MPQIVAVTLFDHFHEVQKRACSVIVTMANRDPEVFGNKTGIFLKALVPCLSHSHSRVRIAVFQAIDAMMQCGLTKGLVAQQLGPGTKSLAFDHTAAVRELYFACVANWLNYKLRAMSGEEIHQAVLSGKIPRFHLPELLPLLLLGVTDDCLDIATSTYEKLEGIGEIYKKFIDHLDTRVRQGPGGKRYNTAEEDAKIMEKVMEEDRKCQERYEREMREKQEEEQRRSQTDNDTRKPTSSSSTSQEISLYQSLRSQTGWMEKEMAEGSTSAEKIGNTELQLSNECREPDEEELDSELDRPHISPHTLSVDTEETTENEGCVSVLPVEESQPKPENKVLESTVLSDTQLRINAPGTRIEAVDSKEEHSTEGGASGASGLHILTNQELKGNEGGSTESTVSPSPNKDQKKGTSEITDEGAVKKLDSGDAGEETLQLPKPYQGRPGAGCRLMVEAFLRPMIEPVLKELKQWTTPTRLCAARMLHTLMVLAEVLAKDNLDILVPAFFSAVGDDDVKVAKRVVATIHIVGFYVPPRKWLALVLKPLGNTKTSQPQRANALVVTAAFLYGTPRKAIEEKHVVKICDKLYEKELCCSDHSAVQNQLLSVVTNLIQVAGALCKTSSFKIFVLLLQLQSVEGDAELQKRSGQVLEDLAKALGMESSRELYVQHIHSMLEIATAGHTGCSPSLPEKRVFQTFMRNANETVGPHLESLMPLFSVCLQDDQDPALRISFLQLLDELFEKQELESSWAPLAPDVIGKILIPCGVWRESKTEASVRYCAMVALGTFLRRGLCSQEHMQEIMQMPEGLLPVVMKCIDEDYFLDVRRATTHVMYQILRVSGLILSDEERTELIKVLMKRVDDSSNLIRRAILPAVAMFFTTMPSTFSDSQVRDFLSFLVVHMNDEHPQIQEGVCKVMEACAVKKPEIVEEVLCSVREHQRSPQHIDRVLAVVAQHTHKSA